MLKRLVDIIGACVGILAASPVMALVAVLVGWRLGSPVFFSQERPGRHGFPFRMLKFRTMMDARDATGRPLPDAERLKPFGRWLRATSIDELPELWNVLRGDMSLVGPRPLLIEYLPLYDERQARRHEIRPGITGWAQINGRNAISWEERLELDIWYIENRSIGLDLRILLRTIGMVLRRKGISATGEATMPRFTGKSRSSAS